MLKVPLRVLISNRRLSNIAEKVKENLYKENEDTKQAITAFKNQLRKVIQLVESNVKKLPLFFFVDELDRCRPKFSIELL